MGTEIVGLLAFFLIALVVSIAWAWKVRSLLVSIVGSALTVVIIVQALNYFSIGHFQLMALTSFAITVGLPAFITLITGFIIHNKKIVQ